MAWANRAYLSLDAVMSECAWYLCCDHVFACLLWPVSQSGYLNYASSGIGVATAICYESIWGEWIAKSVQKDAQFIAVITNDGWWGNTSGKDQHLEYSTLRAIENRRWVARSANTGISAFINQRGDIVQKTKWWEDNAIKQDINLNTELTFYTQHPDWIVFPSLMIGCLGIIFLIFVRLKAKRKVLR